jgi:hypothetical protein
MTTTETPLHIHTDRHAYGDGFAEEVSVEPPSLQISLTPAEAIEALEAWRGGEKFSDHFNFDDYGTYANNEPIIPTVTFEIARHP